MLTQSLFQKISIPQRRVLVAHVASETPLPYTATDSNAVRALISLKLLKWTAGQRATEMTVLGREAACSVLAEYAEALIQAGAGRSPLEQLLTATSASERLQEMKKMIAATRERFEVRPQALETPTKNTSAAG